jgi:hypothetical protein
MLDQPDLTEAEWALICELLERERNELPTEIHHTRTRSLRQELQQRRAMVDELIAKVPRRELV